LKDDRVYLLHISACLERIARYTHSGREAFMADTLVQDGVIRNLQTLAESSRRLSDSLKQSHPEIDWRNIAGFRNVIVHDYLGIDIEQIWDIVEQNLPAVSKAVAAMLAQLGNPPS
jgi:uncharacterized protein with HEPN domain